MTAYLEIIPCCRCAAMLTQGDLDIFEDVVLVRECRPHMVNTDEQFVFLHKV